MVRNILIVRQDRIGDAITATPVPREIKRQWPDARVGVLVRGYTRPLFENNPHIDVILTDDFDEGTRTGSFWARVGQLKKHRFTHALMLLPDQRIAYMLAAAGIRRRYGHGITLFHALTLARPVMYRKSHPFAHQVDLSLALAAAMGVEARDRSMELHLTEREKAMVSDLRRRWGADRKRLIGLHTTHGKSAPNWPPEQWAELIRLLSADPGVQVLITDNLPPAAVDGLPGVLAPNLGGSLRAAMVRLAALDLLVSASTGPMHIAAGLKVPTLSLFCSMANSRPEVWGPVGNDAQFVLPEAEYCRDKCPGHPGECDFGGSKAVSPAALARQILPGEAPVSSIP